MLITNLQYNNHVVIHSNTFLQCGLFWSARSNKVVHISVHRVLMYFTLAPHILGCPHTKSSLASSRQAGKRAVFGKHGNPMEWTHQQQAVEQAVAVHSSMQRLTSFAPNSCSNCCCVCVCCQTYASAHSDVGQGGCAVVNHHGRTSADIRGVSMSCYSGFKGEETQRQAIHCKSMRKYRNETRNCSY